MSPLKQKLQALGKEFCQYTDRAEGSAKSHALASLRDPKNTTHRDEAMKADGAAEAYRRAMQIVEDAARGID